MNYPIIQTATGTADRSRLFITLGAKNKKTGASELAVFSHVFGLDLKKIREDVSVTIGGHRYEPDLAYIDKEKGVYVDIEIDEPYSSFHRPTHFITEDGTHKDQRRNKLFLSAGWHVCRFTEQQMFCQTKSCMKAVYELLLKVGAIEAIPAKLANAPALKFEPCWTAEKSKEALLCPLPQVVPWLRPNDDGFQQLCAMLSADYSYHVTGNLQQKDAPNDV